MNSQPPPPPQAPGPPQPPGDLPTQPPGPTRQKSGKLKWVLLAVGIVVVIVIIAAAVSASKKTSTNKTTTTSSVNTAGTAKSTSPGAATSPGQTTGANQTTYNVPTEAQIGIPFYPGAVVNTERSIKDHSANVTDYVDLEVAGQSIDAVTKRLAFPFGFWSLGFLSPCVICLQAPGHGQVDECLGNLIG